MSEIETVKQIRVLCTNVIGFHALAEEDIPPVNRIMYEAHFAASAVALAVKVNELMEKLSEKREF